MAKGRRTGANGSKLRPLTSVSVEGFKSIDDEQTIEIRPLTILAGVNSSGKSSMIQPLLLMKQTLESSYDPGPLLLHGPNAKFTKVDQLLFKGRSAEKEGRFGFRLAFGENEYFSVRFRKTKELPPLELESVTVSDRGAPFVLLPGESNLHMSPLKAIISLPEDYLVRIRRRRFFVDVDVHDPKAKNIGFDVEFEDFEEPLYRLIHVPGLRGNPQRTYPISAVGDRFPGTFEEYAASVIAVQKETNPEFLKQVGSDLLDLRLTWKVDARRIDDTQVELLVGRLPEPTRGGAQDVVSIADVGFGVSQTLPVVVALLTAQPGQMVYIEQPEIHLHPRAQHAMAKLLARAANRGVQVIIETHSSLLLLGIQSIIASGELDSEKVKLHWFERHEKTGATKISSADFDSAGRFGDWPEDFDDVALHAQQEYLDAAEKKLANS